MPSSTRPAAPATSPTLEGGGMVKGAALREFLVWYEGQYGRDHVPRVMARLTPELAARLTPERMAFGMLPTGWYPSALVHGLLDGLMEGKSSEEITALLREGNQVVVRRLSRGLYHFLFRMVGSPGLYARHIQKAWRLLHTTGEREMILRGDGVADSTIRAWPGHHPILCELTTETMRTVFEAMGCRDVSAARIACVSTGAPACHTILRYDE